MIFWGPPGIGKTTLAMIISNTLHRPFHTLSAISSGVKEVREVINAAQEEEGAILFIDEIHRFNKAQQDSLLGAPPRTPPSRSSPPCSPAARSTSSKSSTRMICASLSPRQ